MLTNLLEKYHRILLNIYCHNESFMLCNALFPPLWSICRVYSQSYDFKGKISSIYQNITNIASIIILYYM